MNSLDWYESWAEDFRETELEFVLPDIHKPKLQTYDFRRSKTQDTSYHKKGKIWHRKRSNHVTTTSQLGMWGGGGGGGGGGRNVSVEKAK